MLSEKDIKGLLRKLAEGSASDQERALLHEYAHNDPFLAEALEGYNLRLGQHGNDLEEIAFSLQKRSAKKIEVRKNRASKWQLAAAIVLLLGVVGWMIRGSLNSPTQYATEGELVVKNPGFSQLDPANPAGLAEENPRTIGANTQEAEEETVVVADRKEASDEADIGSSLSFSSTATSAGKVRPDEELKETQANIELSETEEIVNQARADEESAGSGGRVEAFSQAAVAEKRAAAAPPPSTLYYGQVVDENGDPLIGANVRPLNSIVAQITDRNGRFQIKQEELLDGIEVSYVGYKVKKLNFGEPSALESIVLDELEETSAEVQVIDIPQMPDKKAKKEATLSLTDTALDELYPKGGREKYNFYILQNLKKPDAAIQANIKGAVTISFIINAKGLPEDLQIEKSLGYGCDQEAIRLIENGPKWEGSKSGERIALDIKFR